VIRAARPPRIGGSAGANAALSKQRQSGVAVMAQTVRRPRCAQGVDDDDVAAMGYAQLRGGAVSPAVALQAVREMRNGGDGSPSLQARAAAAACLQQMRSRRRPGETCRGKKPHMLHTP